MAIRTEKLGQALQLLLTCVFAFQPLQPEGIGIGHSRTMMLLPERRDGGRLIEPYKAVELLGKRRFSIVAHYLRFRPIDDTDETLQSWLL
jgi:hypothetical protein